MLIMRKETNVDLRKSHEVIAKKADRQVKAWPWRIVLCSPNEFSINSDHVDKVLGLKWNKDFHSRYLLS